MMKKMASICCPYRKTKNLTPMTLMVLILHIEWATKKSGTEIIVTYVNQLLFDHG
jgi:hypothetical protein